MAKNVVFDQQSAERIAKAVKYVEELQDPEPPVADEIVEQEGRKVIRGTFSGEWAKGTAKDVSFTADNGDGATKAGVYNYFADVGESGVTADCVIIQAGSEWVLVSAEPVTETVEVVTDVECVNNSLVITTETLRVPKQDS